MTRSRNYRQPERPTGERKTGRVVVRRAEPVEDREMEARRGEHEAAKLLARQLGEDARDDRALRGRWRVAGFVIDAIASLFGFR